MMDEAAILGDRVAILANGQLRCVGSPMFLNKRYNVGYVLTIVKAPYAHEASVAALLALVATHVPEVTVASNVGAELTLRIPLGSNAALPSLFTDMDARAAELGIASYGIGVTSMEDVFLRVAGEATAQQAMVAAAAAPPWGGASKRGGGGGGGGGANVAATASATAAATAVALRAPFSTSTNSAAAGAAVVAALPNGGGGGAELEMAPVHAAASRKGKALTPDGSAGGGSGGAPDENEAAALTLGGGTAAKMEAVRKAGRRVHGGWRLHAHHFYALMLKRWQFAKRDVKSALFQAFIPVSVAVHAVPRCVCVNLCAQ